MSGQLIMNSSRPSYKQGSYTSSGDEGLSDRWEGKPGDPWQANLWKCVSCIGIIKETINPDSIWS